MSKSKQVLQGNKSITLIKEKLVPYKLSSLWLLHVDSVYLYQSIFYRSTHDISEPGLVVFSNSTSFKYPSSGDVGAAQAILVSFSTWLHPCCHVLHQCGLDGYATKGRDVNTGYIAIFGRLIHCSLLMYIHYKWQSYVWEDELFIPDQLRHGCPAIIAWIRNYIALYDVDVFTHAVMSSSHRWFS